MNIRVLARELTEAVETFRAKARRFFYRVMLIGHRCLACDGSLDIVSEGLCRCVSCGWQFDPTVAFQRCPVCGGVPVLRIRRYQCRDCGREIASKFLFDGLVFDAQYFRAKMAESRKRKQEQRERVREMLAGSRSGDLPLDHASLGSVPGLVDALNALTAGIDESIAVEARDEFNLKAYENHVQAHIQDFPVNLAEIPPLSEHPKRDLIWRFIAVIFLAHTGVVDIWQEGRNIMVKKHEANREGQDISGASEGSDGVEGLVG
jgi:rubredoxin